MSRLQRSAMATRISQIPLVPPVRASDIYGDTSFNDVDQGDEEEENDDLGDLQSSLNSATTRASSSRSRSNLTSRTSGAPDLTPISAASYFSQAVEVSVPESGLNFRAYYTPPRTAPGDHGTVMVCHHGAGYSALSFSKLAKEIAEETNGECGLLAIDARRHGKTRPLEEGGLDEDLHIDVLTRDFANLMVRLFPKPQEAPSLLLIGHSMGGAVVTRACPALLEKKFRITGAVVLDVVEGSALEALPHMHTLLDSRPDGFDSPEDAIQWHLSNNTIRSVESARISVPSLLVPSERGFAYTWRTPLRSTAPYWTSWFTGLSASFLAARTARLLILAGTDRLDKELMIGQMQGKFQMNVVPNVGHMMHEDDPAAIARILIPFWKRNERVVPGVKKVGEA